MIIKLIFLLCATATALGFFLNIYILLFCAGIVMIFIFAFNFVYYFIYDVLNEQINKLLKYKEIYELKQEIKNTIHRYEHSFHDKSPSCIHEMMDIIEPALDRSIELVPLWKKRYNLKDKNSYFFHDALIHIAIYTAAFDILANSKNHIVIGTVDYSGIANHAEKLLHSTLNYIVADNMITQETKESELSLLEKCIKDCCFEYHHTYQDFYLYKEAIYDRFPPKKFLFEFLLIKE